MAGYTPASPRSGKFQDEQICVSARVRHDGRRKTPLLQYERGNFQMPAAPFHVTGMLAIEMMCGGARNC